MRAGRPGRVRSPWADCGWRSADMVRSIVAAGADPRSGDPPPIHRAFLRGNAAPAAVEALIAAGADPGAADQLGRTALHKAVRFGADPDAVALILAAGADPDPIDAVGVTPLMVAGSCGPDDGVAYLRAPRHAAALLAAGADPSRMDADGVDALCRACASRGAPDLVRILVGALPHPACAPDPRDGGTVDGPRLRLRAALGAEAVAATSDAGMAGRLSVCAWIWRSLAHEVDPAVAACPGPMPDAGMEAAGWALSGPGAWLGRPWAVRLLGAMASAS